MNKPTEKQDFGEQKRPHPERGRFLLLRQRLELMLQRRMMRGMAVRVRRA